jgi:GT2 family glycosyltransferase
MARKLTHALPAGLRQSLRDHLDRVDATILEASGLFDEAWYLKTYPQVAETGLDPPIHFLKRGGFQGLDPGPAFSSDVYLDMHPDVKESGANPLVHYLRYGLYEGRIAAMHDRVTLLRPGEGEVSRPLLLSIVRFLQRAIRVWSDEGPIAFWQKALSKMGMSPLMHPRSRAHEETVHPTVSIVLPVHNALSLTKACLLSIYAVPNATSFELIVIDNASTDGTSWWLRAQQRTRKNLTVLPLDRNLGFGPAANRGIQHSRGRFVLILNNDTLVGPHWLDNLTAIMLRDPSIGIVSPVTNYVGEGPQIDDEARDLPPDAVRIAEYAARIQHRDRPLFEPNRLVFYCVLIRSELFALIGTLDEGYRMGNFEDDDFCLRTRMAGYRLAIAANSFVFHHGSATFKASRISHTRWMLTNRERFFRKAGLLASTPHPYFVHRKAASQISVVVRTKDRPQILERALYSLSNQTFLDLQVVVVNDGIQDVAAVAARVEDRLDVTYIHNSRSLGRTASINEGLRHAKAPWIAYLDDDDILYPWHFEALLSAAKDGSQVVYADYNRALFGASADAIATRIQPVTPWTYDRTELLVQNYLPINSYMHSRDALDHCGEWNETFDRLEDYEFLLRLSGLYAFRHVPKVTSEYRFYVDQESSITSSGKQEYLSALDRIYELTPVTELSLLRRRQLIRWETLRQIKLIEEAARKIGAIEAREIIRMTTGM